MARMPQEYLDARRRHILDAARRCFIRNGFHATTVQDILAEAEVSAGGMYRYFRGKDDIIAAIVAEALSEVARTFEGADTENPPPLDGIVDLVLNVETPPLANTPESARLLVQIWSESLRSPSLAAQLSDVMAESRAVIGGLVAQHQQRGLIPDDTHPEDIARVLIALFDGFMVQSAMYGNANPSAFRAGLRALMAARADQPK